MNLKHLQDTVLPAFRDAVLTTDPGDILLQRVSVSLAPSGLPLITDWQDDEPMYLYSFVFWLNTGKVDPRYAALCGFEYDVLCVSAVSMKAAAKKLYQYLRLIALGESEEVALEVINPGSYGYITHLKYDMLPRPSEAFLCGDTWQSPDGECFASREACEAYMKPVTVVTLPVRTSL